MKLLLITLLLSINSLAIAQRSLSASLRTRTADDSHTLSIQIDGYRNGRKIYHDRTFDVLDINALQKEVIKSA